MKKNLLSLLALGLVMGLFVGCSDSDSKIDTTDPTPTPSAEVTPTPTPSVSPDVPSEVTKDNVLPF